MVGPGASLAGLELLEAVLDGARPQPAIGTALNMTLVEVEDRRTVFEGRPTEAHTNMLGAVHGGYAATVLDSAMGCAVLTTVPSGHEVSTVSLEVKLIRPLVPGTLVLAEGVVIHAGRTHAVAEGSLRDAETGKLLAHGTTTCMISDSRSAAEGAPG